MSKFVKTEIVLNVENFGFLRHQDNIWVSINIEKTHELNLFIYFWKDCHKIQKNTKSKLNIVIKMKKTTTQI